MGGLCGRYDTEYPVMRRFSPASFKAASCQSHSDIVRHHHELAETPCRYPGPRLWLAARDPFALLASRCVSLTKTATCDGGADCRFGPPTAHRLRMRLRVERAAAVCI